MSGFDWVVPMPIIGSNPVKIHLGQVKCEIFFQITREYGTHRCIIFGWSWTTLTGITDDFILENFLIPQCIVKFAKIHFGFKLFLGKFQKFGFFIGNYLGEKCDARTDLVHEPEGNIFFMHQYNCKVIKISAFFLYKVKVKKMSILFFVARKVIVFMEIQVSFLLLSFA